MDEQQADKLVKQLVRGFDALVQEYQELLRSHQKLKERAAKEVCIYTVFVTMWRSPCPRCYDETSLALDL